MRKLLQSLAACTSKHKRGDELNSIETLFDITGARSPISISISLSLSLCVAPPPAAEESAGAVARA